MRHAGLTVLTHMAMLPSSEATADGTRDIATVDLFSCVKFFV
jgi:hypothetical protein